MKINTFFSPDGISSSAANFIAELAKTRNAALVTRIDSATAYVETVNFQGAPVIIVNPTPVDLLEVKHIADLYALSAWLREAIKAKNELLEHTRGVDDTFFGAHPEFAPIPVKHFVAPVAPVEPTPEEAISQFTQDELVEYFTLEANAAHIGKRIHPDGSIYKLAADVAAHRERKAEFCQIDGASHVKTFTPVYDESTVTQTVSELHHFHNEFQRKLNWYKARIQNWITQTKARRMAAYKAEVENRQNEVNENNQRAKENVAAYNSAVVAAKAGNEEKRMVELKSIASYKIAIPSVLQPVYQLLSQSLPESEEA